MSPPLHPSLSAMRPPTMTPVEVAYAFLEQRMDAWLPSPAYYSLPLLYEHAAIEACMKGPGNSFSVELGLLKNLCIEWLKLNTSPADQVPRKYVPAVDHLSNRCWHNFSRRRSFNLPTASTLHAAVLTDERTRAWVNANRTPKKYIRPYLTVHVAAPRAVPGAARAVIGVR